MKKSRLSNRLPNYNPSGEIAANTFDSQGNMMTRDQELEEICRRGLEQLTRNAQLLAEGMFQDHEQTLPSFINSSTVSTNAGQHQSAEKGSKKIVALLHK